MSSRKSCEVNSVQSSYKIKETKEQNRVPKESMPKRCGLEPFRTETNLCPNELKDIKKIIRNMKEKTLIRIRKAEK